MRQGSCVVAVLSMSRERSLRSRVGRRIELLTTSSMSVAAAYLQREVGGLLIIDPKVLSDRALESLLRATEDTGASSLIYTDLASASSKRTLRFMREAEAGLVLCDVDDDPEVLWTRITAMPAISIGSMVLHRLEERIGALLGPLMSQVLAVFTARRIPNQPNEFCDCANTRRRTCERELSRAGLVGIAKLLRGARLAQSWPMLPTRISLADVAARSGFSSEARLCKTYNSIVGLPPGAAARRLESVTVADLLAAALRK